jgi:hypothetical protein
VAAAAHLAKKAVPIAYDFRPFCSVFVLFVRKPSRSRMSNREEGNETRRIAPRRQTPSEAILN